MKPTELKVGELAERTGISVRTLHHYHDLGLLVPAFHSPGEPRRYSVSDLERLLRIRALKQLGLSLDEIGACLDRGASLDETLTRHASALRARLAEQARLAARLDELRVRLAADEAPSVDRLVEALEMIEMIEKHYTDEQREQLAARAKDVGEERIRAVQQEWADLFAGLRTAMDVGKDPSDSSVQELVARGKSLIAEFTGGDAGVTKSLGEMYSKAPNPHEIAGTDADVWAFYRRACE